MKKPFDIKELIDDLHRKHGDKLKEREEYFDKNNNKITKEEYRNLKLNEFIDDISGELRKGQKKNPTKEENFFFYVFVVIFTLLINLIIHLLRT